MTTREQVHEALEAWLEAQQGATNAAAAYAELKSIVGGNEAERKAQQAKTPAEEYELYRMHFADAERAKSITAAAAERSEKVLNVLREVLQAETADTNRATAELAARTADRYAALQMTPPARVVVRVQPTPIDDSDLPF